MTGSARRVRGNEMHKRSKYIVYSLTTRRPQWRLMMKINCNVKRDISAIRCTEKYDFGWQAAGPSDTE